MDLRQYHVGHVLGSGAFGEVRLVTSKLSGEKLALKCIDKGSVSDVSEVDRVSREFYILTSLDHKHVIRLHEVFQDESKLYLVMEYAGASTCCEL